MSYHFCSDEIKKDLPNWMYTSPAPTHCLDVIGASTKSYTIYKVLVYPIAQNFNLNFSWAVTKIFQEGQL